MEDGCKMSQCLAEDTGFCHSKDNCKVSWHLVPSSHYETLVFVTRKTVVKYHEDSLKSPAFGTGTNGCKISQHLAKSTCVPLKLPALITRKKAAKCPEVFLKIHLFVLLKTAAKVPTLLTTPSFVDGKTAAMCPSVMLGHTELLVVSASSQKNKTKPRSVLEHLIDLILKKSDIWLKAERSKLLPSWFIGSFPLRINRRHTTEVFPLCLCAGTENLSRW